MIRVYRIALSVTNDLDKSQFTKGLASFLNTVLVRDFGRGRGATRAHKGAYINVCDRSKRVKQRSHRTKDQAKNCLRLYGQVNKRIW